MNKEKLCGCGKKATIESTRKMIACSNCTIKFQEFEKDFENYQMEKRQKKNDITNKELHYCVFCDTMKKDYTVFQKGCICLHCYYKLKRQ